LAGVNTKLLYGFINAGFKRFRACNAKYSLFILYSNSTLNHFIGQHLGPIEQHQEPVSSNRETQKGKANKKRNMIKVDPSFLGFTVHAALDRIVGEISKPLPTL